jgi:hypothetical protein
MSSVQAAFFAKNLPVWERVLRLIVSAAAAGFGFNYGGMLGMALVGSAVVFTLTSLFGFCPMCALAGRRLASKN